MDIRYVTSDSRYKDKYWIFPAPPFSHERYEERFERAAPTSLAQRRRQMAKRGYQPAGIGGFEIYARGPKRQIYLGNRWLGQKEISILCIQLRAGK